MKLISDCQNLIDKYMSNTITKEELTQLLEIVKYSHGTEPLLEALKNHWDAAKQIDTKDDPYWDENFTNILQASVNSTPSIVPYQKKKIGKILQTTFVAVAGMILFAAGYTYFNFNYKLPVKKVVSKTLACNILPGSNKAFLTLANGTSITLDSASNGLLAKQGSVNIIKSRGKLSYKINEKLKSEEVVQYNTMQTPRGGQYQLTLPDGTQVWLNSASSIHFPTSFAGIERHVEITGEVYFEVTKNAGRPFTVTVNGMNVKVLGTHFNINAYKEEAVTKTTLLEGSVIVTKGNAVMVLHPGNQALVNEKGDLTLIKNVAIEEAIAWKNGYFYFRNSSLQSVLRQLSRWYDVDVMYDGAIADRAFGGEICRNLTLAQILQIFDKSKIHFNVEGKKITVKSN